LKEEEQRLNRWKEYFEELFNVDNKIGEMKDDEDQKVEDEKKQDETPTLDEVSRAIECLKSFKAAGPDGVLAEVLKAGGSIVKEWAHRIIAKIWTTQQYVEEWHESPIVPLFKKGDSEICDNYRGISLLSIASKILSKVLYWRIENKVETKLHEAQCGFRRGRGCVDQIFNLKECISMSRQKNQPLFMCFIDLRKAYDSVNRDLLWKALRSYGLSEKTIRILTSIYKDTTARVRVNASLSVDLENGCQARMRVIATSLQYLFGLD
jgi:hypothetical protein